MQKYRVGIFWYINDLLLSLTQHSEKNEMSDLTGKIDSDFSHLICWDIYFNDIYPDADYATFPRGRTLYDLRKNLYIIYADFCIPDSVIAEYAQKNDLYPFVVARDAHYQCDKCLGLST